MAPSSNSGPMYQKDEKALCFHGDLMYEAKVVDTKIKDPNDKAGGYMYRVHYKGWKNTWDDWVPQGRLRKKTDENVELAANLRKDMEAQRRQTSKPSAAARSKGRLGSDLANSSTRGSEERSSAAPQAQRGTKRGREIEGIDKEEDFVRRPAIRIIIPEPLKSMLVDDWEKVTKEHRLVPLPSQKPVTKFLNDYYHHESINRRPGSPDADILEEVIAGLKEYFNKALGRLLLYRFERQQYYTLFKQIDSGHGEHAGETLADVYGCEHLLRLFTALPDLLAHTNMDTPSVERLRKELNLMTAYLSNRIEQYLSTEYEHAGQDYQDGSKGAA